MICSATRGCTRARACSGEERLPRQECTTLRIRDLSSDPSPAARAERNRLILLGGSCVMINAMLFRHDGGFECRIDGRRSSIGLVNPTSSELELTIVVHRLGHPSFAPPVPGFLSQRACCLEDRITRWQRSLLSNQKDRCPCEQLTAIRPQS
jgi:hypothetical protein